MKQFLKFLTKIKSFWKLYKNYGYDGETVEFIIENYQEVLCSRTKLMSNPLYYAKDVINQIDDWYDEMEQVRIKKNDDKFRNQIEFIIRYEDINSKDELIDMIWEKIQKLIMED